MLEGQSKTTTHPKEEHTPSRHGPEWPCSKGRQPSEKLWSTPRDFLSWSHCWGRGGNRRKSQIPRVRPFLVTPDSAGCQACELKHSQHVLTSLSEVTTVATQAAANQHATRPVASPLVGSLRPWRAAFSAEGLPDAGRKSPSPPFSPTCGPRPCHHQSRASSFSASSLLELFPVLSAHQPGPNESRREAPVTQTLTRKGPSIFPLPRGSSVPAQIY